MKHDDRMNLNLFFLFNSLTQKIFLKKTLDKLDLLLYILAILK